MFDPFRLARFVEAQEQERTYERALDELQAGRKESHWMWFVFPQLAGLGHSAQSQFYAISSLDEATAYLAHRLLGTRLLECTAVLRTASAMTAEEIFGEADALKLRSSMTLFHRASPDQDSFIQVLGRYFAGNVDSRTDDLLRIAERASGGDEVR